MAETPEELALRLASQPALFTNFVDFTSTLIRGVFDTLVDVTREQLKTYVDMVSALSGGPDQFILQTLGNVDDAALKYLNQVVLPTYTTHNVTANPASLVTTGTSVNVATPQLAVTLKPLQMQPLLDSFKGVDIDGNGTPNTLAVTLGGTPVGTTNTVTLGDLYAFTKAFLVRAGHRSFDELQALLRMGLARVVPNEGFIETALTFAINTNTTSEQSSSQTTTDVSSRNKTFVGGFSNTSNGAANYLRILRGTFQNNIDARNTSDKSNSQVMVSVVNQKSTAATNLRIDVVGRVNLKFITDYFPLLPAAEPQ
jgi:hypothetical protein